MTFNVMTHKSYETFLLKHYMLWTKTTYQSTIFQTFMCSNESSPNSLCHFWNHKVSIYSDFPSLFSVMKDNSLYFCSLNLVYFGQKESIEKNFSDFWMVGRKFTSYHTWKRKSFFLCITRQCHERYLFCNFLAETLYKEQKEPIKVQSDSPLPTWNFTKFLLW